MTNTRQVTVPRPALFVLLAGLALIAAQFFWLYAVPGLSGTARAVAGKVTECAVALALLARLGWWCEAGLIRRWHLRDAVPALPLLIVPLLMVASQASRFGPLPPATLAFFAIVAAMTGFAEEVVFRGVALRALAARGPLRAAFVSSAIFGMLHVINLVRGADPVATAVQIVFAFLFGVAFAAPLLVTGSIWPIMVLHALQDFLAFWSTGSLTERATPSVADAAATVVIMVPLAAYGVWLIWRTRATG